MNAATLEKITRQQGKEHSHVWHCGEHVKEFLERFPQYEDLISTDLDNGLNLSGLEAEIRKAAKAFGGGIGGADADAVLRKFFGLPETDAGPVRPAPAPAPAFDFSATLL